MSRVINILFLKSQDYTRQARDSQGRVGFSVWRLRAQVRNVASRGLAAERGDDSVRSVASSKYRGEGRGSSSIARGKHRLFAASRPTDGDIIVDDQPVRLGELQVKR